MHVMRVSLCVYVCVYLVVRCLRVKSAAVLVED